MFNCSLIVIEIINKITTVQQQYKFSGHETFPFRYGWLKKGLDAVNEEPTFFAEEDAMIDLGVGKNMVLSIKHWCLAAGLIEPQVLSANPRNSYVLTEIGSSIFSENGFDPYLEDPATLWLLHWKIASNTQDCTTWFWLFNLWHSVNFTKEQIIREMTNWLEQQNLKAISANSLKRDIECCFRTYIHSRQKSESIAEDTLDCPLAELNLIIEVEDNRTYQFIRDGQASLPDEIFLFALSDFWLKYNGESNNLSLQRIAYDPGSPGKTFKLDEESLVRRLEDVKNSSKNAFSYDETSGIKQIYRHQNIEPIEWLKQHYQNKKSDAIIQTVKSY